MARVSFNDARDIALHSLPQALFCFMAGAMLRLGWSIAGEALGIGDQAVGYILFVCGGFAFIGAMFYWLGRERRQHGYVWGKFQSFLEWSVPAVAGSFFFLIGLWLGTYI